MKKLLNFFKSFSFRIGFIIFVVFCSVLITLRVGIYNKAIHNEENDIKEIIQAQFANLYETYERNGPEVTIGLISELVKSSHNQHLVMGIKYKNKIFGNLNNFPSVPRLNNKWIFLELVKKTETGQPPSDDIDDEDNSDDKQKFNFLAKIHSFNRDTSILVAYEMNDLEKIKTSLFKYVIKDIQIAIICSLILSFVIVFILNRYHRRFNKAYNKVRGGNLSYRIRTNKSNDQFDILSNNFNSMMNWVEALLNTVKDTTNSIAHDLRTPLSRHRNGLESIINKSGLDSQISEDLRNSVTEVDHIIKMFNNILSISKAEGRSGIEYFEKFEINEILGNLTEFFEPLAEEKKISLRLALDGVKAEIMGDKQLFTQALFNLIDNAIKYNKKDSVINISLEKEDHHVVITVEDNGNGIPDTLLEKVKEKFFRIDESRTSSGSGLGLSLVDAVAKLHNGQLTLSNNNPGLKAQIIIDTSKKNEFYL